MRHLQVEGHAPVVKPGAQQRAARGRAAQARQRHVAQPGLHQRAHAGQQVAPLPGRRLRIAAVITPFNLSDIP